MKVVVFISSIFLISCANKGGYYQFHDGEPLPPNKKVIIEGHYGYRDGTIANEMTRIVEIDGKKIPKQWGVAEGANKVSLLPGYHEIKILYVHGVNSIDYYAYTKFPAIFQENCTYKIYTKWSSYDKSINFDLVGTPSSADLQASCETLFQPEKKEQQAI